jgi:hypothetical protein
MLSDAEQARLGEIGHRLGKGSRRGRNRRPAGHDPGLVPQAGRPQILWLAGSSRSASENQDWGYDRIAGAMANLGYPRCFSSVSAPWAGAERICRITMRSVIIRGRTTSCCFLVTRKRDAAGLCNVAKGWDGLLHYYHQEAA